MLRAMLRVHKSHFAARMPPPMRSSRRCRQGLPLRVRRQIKAAPDTAGARGRRQAFFTAEQYHHRARFPLAQALGLFAMPPICLSDEQMSALLAASHPLPPDSRSAFLEHCALELARLPIVGDGVLHRVIMQVQREYFDPPDLSAGASGRSSKYR